MKIKKLLIIMLFFSYEIALAQSHEEALFFSTQNYIGTARSSAMGNAFGALGADMTSIHINPAGLGLYRTFNMSFTLGLGMNEISTYYMGNKYVDKSGNFNLNSLGISSVGKKDIENDWRRINYSFSYNRTKRIKNSYQIMGFNNSSSMIDVFNDLAQGQLISELNQFYEGAAFWVDLIDQNTDDEGDWLNNGQFFQQVASGQKQRFLSSNFGSMGEFQVSFASSYKDNLYLGGSISVPHIDYSSETFYLENNFTDTSSSVQSFSMLNSLYTSGLGINFKIGGIYRVNDNLRIGLSWHSPSFFNMQDEWEMRMNADHSINDSTYSYSYTSDYGIYNYKLVTPMKLISSAAFILNKKIIFSGDLEWIDYSSMNLKGSDVDYFNSQNNFINQRYRSTYNSKLGVEINLSPILLRAGYSRFGNPIVNDILDNEGDNNFNDSQLWSFGFGVRNNYSYIDFAYVYSENQENKWLYNRNYVSPAKIVNSDHNIVVTLGWKF